MNRTMKRAQTEWSDGLWIFSGAGESVEVREHLRHRALEEIEDIKLAYAERRVTFEYRGETIRGTFVDAIEGEFPGTYTLVLRIPSSRICQGPCFIHDLHGNHVGGIVVTGEHGLIAITAKVAPL